MRSLNLAEQTLVNNALSVLELALRREEDAEFTAPDTVRHFLTLRLGKKHREYFSLLFLDNRHRMIAYETLFRGTIDGASVHPREVAKRSLELNAAAVILAHNHPSGVPEPSRADIALTKRLVDALRLVEVRVLDHFVIGGTETVSFAERGLL